jgi:hypothetical protein
MEYHVLCQCGKQVPVSADDAGTTIHCQCGQSVPVPSLSKLRTTAGVGAYESGAIDTIRRMLDEGTLPWGETCAESGRPTADIIRLVVQCERLHAARDGSAARFLILFFLGPFYILLAMRAQEREAHGRETMVRVPLRLSREYHRGLARWWAHRRRRRLLTTVPVYAALLKEYPKATIRVDAASTDFESQAAR